MNLFLTIAWILAAIYFAFCWGQGRHVSAAVPMTLCFLLAIRAFIEVLV